MDITAHFKKGYKTTEFWVTIAAAAIALINATTGLDLDSESVIALAVTIASYVASRSYLKSRRVEAVAISEVGSDVLGPPVG